MKIVVASDHTALELRGEIKTMLADQGHEMVDLGPFVEERADYPLFGAAAARMVADKKADLGIIICGTGLGISLAANKTPGIRCCVCSEPYTARMSRQHNDANMLALGARVVGTELAKDIVQAFVDHEFEGGRHARRVDQIIAMDKDVHALDAELKKIMEQADC